MMKGVSRVARGYWHLARTAARMAFHRSYWHLPQGPGRHFVPGELRGYFNDLRSKTLWGGETDEQGMPVNYLNGRRRYFATTVLQKGLGHWDRWLDGGEHASVHRNELLRIADWAARHQDRRGGWPMWDGLPGDWQSPYSAMTQGEGISLLARAYVGTGDGRYQAAARCALHPLLTSIDAGGTARITRKGMVLEEYPGTSLSGVLNGWIFAIMGLYDFRLTDGSLEADAALTGTLETLCSYLHQYDAGYWSYYDLAGTLASPFYHRLHIAQLQALELAFPQYASIFGLARVCFSAHSSSRWRHVRAVLTKAGQKLLTPPEVTMR